MEKIVSYIAKQLVSKPEEVRVETSEEKGLTKITLYLDKEDMGRVIGRKGRIAKNIRAILRAVAMKNDQEVELDIVEK
ncbi:MAG: KH domain-containing protein [Tissierellia bacterium]|nr:KH domain-containing protein [Tissierellia bacterium]